MSTRLRFLVPVWLLAGVCAPASAGDLPAMSTRYVIDAQLEPETRELTGTVDLTWTNMSSEGVWELPVHLYLNAFAHEATTFLREPVPSGRRDHREVLERYDDPWGWTQLIEVTQGEGSGARCTVTPWQPDDGNPQDETLVRVGLPTEVAPGATTRVRFQFEARLPVPIARTGGVDDYFFVAQWYPKLAVRGSDGKWTANQFHRATEFFADFADYEVTLRVPEGWVVGATGARDAQDSGAVTYRQRAVHDFAFVAGANLQESVSDAGGVELRIIAPPGSEALVERVRASLTIGLATLALRVGPYPYATLTAVLPPFRARRTSGMEYPTLITGFPADPLFEAPVLRDLVLPESVAVHELAHQYFYGLVATDERAEAFLDEGFTTYWEGEILEAIQKTDTPSVGQPLGANLDWTALRSSGLRGLRPAESVAQRPAWLFADNTAGAQIYARTAVTLRTAEARFGQTALDDVFAAYFGRFAFAHPTVDDFVAVAHGVNPDLASFLREAWTRPDVPDFRVASATAEEWSAPKGWVRGQEGSRAKDVEGGPALGADGRAEVRTPGYVRGVVRVDGDVVHRSLEVSAAGETTDEEWVVSEVLVEGPGWDHLPVTVTFVFDDGTVLEDAWDGRAAWRRWRFVRRARLLRATVGPPDVLAMDPTPGDNSLAVAPSRAFQAHWAGFASALGQWMASGASLWL